MTCRWISSINNTTGINRKTKTKPYNISSVRKSLAHVEPSWSSATDPRRSSVSGTFSQGTARPPKIFYRPLYSRNTHDRSSLTSGKKRYHLIETVFQNFNRGVFCYNHVVIADIVSSCKPYKYETLNRFYSIASDVIRKAWPEISRAYSSYSPSTRCELVLKLFYYRIFF